MSTDTDPKPSPIVGKLSGADILRNDFCNIIADPEWVKNSDTTSLKVNIGDLCDQLWEVTGSLYIKTLSTAKRLNKEDECVKLFRIQYNNLLDLTTRRLKTLLGGKAE